MSTIAGIVIALLQIYMFLIGIRIILSWTGVRHDGAGMLAAVVDPYLNLFRRFKFLRTQHLDLSPFAAVLVLNLAMYVISQLGSGIGLSFVDLLVFFIGMIWNFASFLIGLMVVMALVRLLGFAFPPLKDAPIWHAMDLLLMPPVTRIGMILRRGFLTYRTGLILLALLGVGLFILGNWGVVLLIRAVLYYVPR